MWTRRDVLKTSARLAAAGATWGWTARTGRVQEARADEQGATLNDVQSQLNATRVHRVVQPKSLDDVQAALAMARRERRAVSLAGGRHAMGGQQFGTDALHLDFTGFNRVLHLDRERGLVEVEGGIQWPELIDYLVKEQAGAAKSWSIREKQTGVDRVSLAGSLASNIHGRGLGFPPIIGDVESFVLVDGHGKAHPCSRRENPELFSLAIGGYGLFGAITHVTLRLVPRTKLKRVVEIVAIKDLLAAVDKRVEQGFVYGDCQYSTDLEVDAESHAGVFPCYVPVSADTPIPDDQKSLSAEEWTELYKLARTDKKRAFERYSAHYLATTGQIYWSDTHQLAGSFDAYRKAAGPSRGTEMITEGYVSRDAFVPCLAKVRQDFLDHKVDMTYGTIRFIEKDTESFLAWARERSVCIVCNLHVVHTFEGKRQVAEHFRRILDRVVEFGGRYYLTYHRWATRKHVEASYPQFVDFLKLKKKFDPDERFQSDWYRHYREMFADRL